MSKPKPPREHRHRWVKAPQWAVCTQPMTSWSSCCGRGQVMCREGEPRAYHARCAYHDPRRPPTKEEREERRVLLRAAKQLRTRITIPGGSKEYESALSWAWLGPDFHGSAALAESAAYSWTPHGPERTR